MMFKTFILFLASALLPAFSAGVVAFFTSGPVMVYFFAGFLAGAAVFQIVWKLGTSDLRKRLTILEKVYSCMSESAVVTDDRGNIEDVNPAFITTTGFERQELIGLNPRIMKSGRHDPEFYGEMWRALLVEGTWQGEIWDRRKTGEVYPKWLGIEAIKDGKGRPCKFVGVFSDISSVKKANEQLDYLLWHDRLTELPNRTAFMGGLMQAFWDAKKRKLTGALLVANINRLRGVNEAFGFEGGDAVLLETAKRLGPMFEGRGVVARTGSDEFSILMTQIPDASGAAAAATEIIHAMSQYFIIKGQYIYLGVNIGICLFPVDADSHENVLAFAQKALLRAKGKGTNQFEFFNAEAERGARDKLQIETNLRIAIENKEFVLHYQPLVDLGTGGIYGAEALIRRVGEPGHLISPGYFIEIAEETGLIVDICEWTLMEAAKQQVAWIKEGLPPVLMSVNATAMQFHQNIIVPKVKETIELTGIEPGHLKIEITERAVMRNAEAIIRQLRELKELGVKLSIDDFGTGYSSLGYLRRFPVDIIKVDISFVHEIGRSRDGETLIRAIINLAHDLGFRALAEGVETEEQLAFLKSAGCDEMQGFLFSRPLPAERFAALLPRSGQ